MNRETQKPIELYTSFSIFAFASLILIIETHYVIPWLSHVTGWETVVLWFLVAGLGLFLPLLIVAGFILKKEGHFFDKDLWLNRLRFKKMDRTDWLWSIGAIVVICVLSGLIMEGVKHFTNHVHNQPPFMSLEPLTSDRYWILLLWLPYWLLNIMGEEILWRGTILPRQEVVLGNFAWLFHGFCWGIFHIAFGWQLLVTLIPILFIQSFVVQKRKNSWIGVVIHAGINGPSFLAIAFGILN